MSDKILLLNFGQIEQQGTPEDMYNRPQTQFTAEFMGSNNRLPGTIAEVTGGRALLEGEGYRLWGAARGEPQGGRQGDGDHPPRADEDRRVRPEKIALRPSSSPRCSWATGASICTSSARCACVATATPRPAIPRIAGWNCPPTIFGCSRRKLKRTTHGRRRQLDRHRRSRSSSRSG